MSIDMYIFLHSEPHLSVCLSVSLSVVVPQTQKPCPYVKEMNDAATFYTNRVLKDYKDSYVALCSWCSSSGVPPQESDG